MNQFEQLPNNDVSRFAIQQAGDRQRSFGPHGGHAATGSELDIKKFFGIIRRRAKLIALTILSLFILCILVIVALNPRYTSSALILVDTTNKNLLDPGSQSSNPMTDDGRINSEVEIINSESVLVKVIDAKDLTDDAEIGARPGWLTHISEMLRIMPPQSGLSSEARIQGTLKNLKKHLLVSRIAGTYLIAVKVTSADPAKSADLANAVAQAYIGEQVARKVDSTLVAKNVLSQRIERASEAIRSTEDAVSKFISGYLDTLAASGNSSEISSLRDRLTAEREQRRQLLAKVDQVNLDADRGQWAAVARALQSETMGQLAGKFEVAQNQLLGMQEDSLESKGLRSELGRLEGELKQKTASEVDSMKETLAASESKIRTLQEEARKSVLGSDLPTEVLAKLYQLQQEADVARAQYQTLLSRLKDIEAQAELQVADSRVVSSALPAADASFPNIPMFLLFAGFGGCALGTGLAFLYENIIGGFTSEEQAASVLDLPTMLSVPRRRMDKNSGLAGSANPAATLLTDPQSRYAEAIRRIMVAIDLAKARRRNDNGQKKRAFVVMVGSSVPNEGKTTLALSIARSYAIAGHSTLLIDCDMRKPSLRAATGTSVTTSIQSLFGDSGEARISLKNIVTMDEGTALKIIYGSRQGDRPVLGSQFAKQLINIVTAVSQSFDIIVLDTPPALPVVDSLYLAPIADTIVFAIHWATTSQRDAGSALDSLRASCGPECQIIGVLCQKDNNSFEAWSGYYNSYET